MKIPVICLLLLATTAYPQRKVDPRNSYQRLICLVPITGSGTLEDPRRPMYTPAPPNSRKTMTSTILAWSQQISDDGRYAIVEYAARDRSAFAAILADHSIKVFTKGIDKKDAIERELRKYKKDFDFDKFGLAIP